MVLTQAQDQLDRGRTLTEGQPLTGAQPLADRRGWPPVDQFGDGQRPALAALGWVQGEQFLELVEHQHRGLERVAAPQDGGLEQGPEVVRGDRCIGDALCLAGPLQGLTHGRERCDLGAVQTYRYREQVTLAQAREDPGLEQ